MPKLLYLLTFLTAATAASVLNTRTDTLDTSRYSACYPDRGYTKDDASKASAFLWQNATFANGLKMTTGDCIYKQVDTTISSLCNGSARNRTVYQPEVRRGFEQLSKDCSAGGTFNGVHVVNNLTFAIYGITGRKTISIPPGAADPDLPTFAPRKRGSGHVPKLQLRQQEPAWCTSELGFKGTPRTDCNWVNRIAPDGTCPGDLNPGNKCSIFCEQSRTGLLGIEQDAPGDYAKPLGPGLVLELQEGLEVSVSNGFSIGVDGVFKDAIGAGLSYQYSKTITTTKSYTMGNDPDPKYGGRFVVFPQYVSSCGILTSRTFIPGDAPVPCGLNCIPVSKPDSCDGPVTSTYTCMMTPYLKNGEAQSTWAWRLEDDEMQPVPMELQSGSYKYVCKKDEILTQNPDGDGESECRAFVPPGSSIPANPALMRV